MNGCFDYECECGGKSCDHVGGQLNESKVVIEVPLSDGTDVYLEGDYEEYGYVTVGKYKFYPEQFKEFFKTWLDGESDEERNTTFLSKRIWTRSETTYAPEYDCMVKAKRSCFHDKFHISKVNAEMLGKFIRADNGLNIRSKKQAQEDRLRDLKALLS